MNPIIVLCAVGLFPFPAGQVESGAASPAQRIVIDGEFDDWRAVHATTIDPADAPPDATLDLGEIRISHDERFVHLLFDVGRNVNLQGMNSTLMILLDADGDPATGRLEHGLAGVDVIIDCSPRSAPHRPGFGIAVRSTTYQPPADDPTAKLNPYDIGLMFSPTYAGRRFEMRFERGATLPQTPALFGGERFAGKIVAIQAGGEVEDEVETFIYELDQRAKPPAAADLRHAAENEDDPLAKLNTTDLRVMSWNVERGAMFTNPEPFAHTFAAIAPDVVLLQELKDTNTAEQIAQFLTKALPQGEARWHVIFGAGGGDLRCAVAARLPLNELEPFRAMPMRDRPDRTLRAAAAILEINSRRLLIVSAHLRCCGNATGPEDEQRRLEAEMIQSAITAAFQAHTFDGVIVGGDFNLVGSRDPLELLASGADLDRSNLTIAPAYQLDGLSNTTWSDRKQPFTPGRLDFLLISDSRLHVLRTFVFDSADLPEKWATHHQVQTGDSACSDHMPVVADLKLKRE